MKYKYLNTFIYFNKRNIIANEEIMHKGNNNHYQIRTTYVY